MMVVSCASIDVNSLHGNMAASCGQLCCAEGCKVNQGKHCDGIWIRHHLLQLNTHMHGNNSGQCWLSLLSNGRKRRASPPFPCTLLLLAGFITFATCTSVAREDQLQGRTVGCCQLFMEQNMLPTTVHSDH